MYFSVLIAGFFGGVVRGLIGFIKHQFSYKDVPFNLKYFLGMSFLSGIIGISVAAAVKEIGFTYQSFFTPALAFIVGYAGGDFIESIYKIIIKKSSFYPKDNSIKLDDRRK
ncbi:hypothetical protein J7K42_02040 [bacterium]|nr:hypothetical protein [bacterium]